MSTAANVRDSARALLGVGTSESAGGDAEMLTWLNLDYANLRRKVAQIIPDRYTALVTFDIAAGANTYTIAATDFDRVRKVGRRWGGSGSEYKPLPMLSFANAESAGVFGWCQRGLILDFFPILSAPNTAGVDGYQLSYLTKAATLAAGDTVDLPAGMERVLEMLLVARGKIRLGDSPVEAYQLARDFEKEDLLSLAAAYPGSPDVGADMTGFYG